MNKQLLVKICQLLDDSLEKDLVLTLNDIRESVGLTSQEFYPYYQFWYNEGDLDNVS